MSRRFVGAHQGAQGSRLWNARSMAPDDELSLDRQIDSATQRLHILEPLLQALDQPHRVLDVLLEAQDAEAGRSALATEFGLDLIQATAVMDAQFRRVTQSDRLKIRTDVAETLALLESLRKSP